MSSLSKSRDLHILILDRSLPEAPLLTQSFTNFLGMAIDSTTIGERGLVSHLLLLLVHCMLLQASSSQWWLTVANFSSPRLST